MELAASALPPADPGAREPDTKDLTPLIGLGVGIIVFVLILVLPRSANLSAEAQRVGAVAALMGIWWMTEALPLAATALVPLCLFPLLGVMTPAAASAPYANQLIFLFMGGFFIAAAMERWGLHRRIALGVVARVGTQPRRLVLGFMLATAFVSMWISNTATAVMMVPIGTSILVLFDDEPHAKPLGTALLLGIAYAATIGGMATLIGSPTNAVFAGAADTLFGREVGFFEWMSVGAPLAALLLPITWFLLVRVVTPLPAGSGSGVEAEQAVQAQRVALGPMNRGERITAVVFAVTVLAWLVRDPKQIGALTIPGIATYFPQVTDSTIAITAALLLFLIPQSMKANTAPLNWSWARRIPWDVLLLFGGGLSLAAGFEATGLATWIGSLVSRFADLPLALVIIITAVLFMVLTEFTSNTATTTMGMPIMAGVALGMGVDPLTLMGVAVLSTQCSFMLPVATPPNAIVFGSGRVTIREMMRTGILMNVAGIVIITALAFTLFEYAFGP
jgi:sodium-dependent dicarboxylate transporter 2/3/5